MYGQLTSDRGQLPYFTDKCFSNCKQSTQERAQLKKTSITSAIGELVLLWTQVQQHLQADVHIVGVAKSLYKNTLTYTFQHKDARTYLNDFHLPGWIATVRTNVLNYQALMVDMILKSVTEQV